MKFCVTEKELGKGVKSEEKRWVFLWVVRWVYPALTNQAAYLDRIGNGFRELCMPGPRENRFALDIDTVFTGFRPLYGVCKGLTSDYCSVFSNCSVQAEPVLSEGSAELHRVRRRKAAPPRRHC